MASKLSNAQLQQNLDSFTERIENAIKGLTLTAEVTKNQLIEKIDGITTRLDVFDEKIAKIERSIAHTDNRVGELSAQIENGDVNVSQKFTALTTRIEELERKIEKLEKLEELPKKIEPLENLPTQVDQLAEKIEDRTNRQLRETLVFKNIPETGRDETYKETKELLATTISRICPDISYQDALSQIK